jgi:hypothetical protein
MLVVNLGCSPHFEQRGEVGFCQSCSFHAAQNAEKTRLAS